MQDQGLSDEGEGLAVEDRGRVDPAGGYVEVVQTENWAGCQTLLGQGIDRVVHDVIGVGLNPGEPQRASMGAEEEQEELEKMEHPSRSRGRRDRNPGEARPTVMLHGQQATANQAEDE